MQTRTLILCGLVAAGSMLAADAGYFGKWKLDPARSDFGDTTFTVSQTPSGEMQYSADGQTYTFKVDGKDYPAMFGGTSAWKSGDKSSWEVTNKMNGKPVTTDTYKLSADGKSLTVNSKGPKPAGGMTDDTFTFQRVSGDSGLAGKWKTKNFKSTSPDTVELVAAGADGMAFNIPEQKAVCNLKFDGKDYAVTGPTMPANMTATAKRSGNGFDMTYKMAGKALYQSSFTVSPDGKTLTEAGSALATGEKYKAVFARQ
jgi:hypothetical protein